MWLSLLATHWLATISIMIKEQAIMSDFLFHGVSYLFLLVFLVVIRGISQQLERHVKIIKTNGCQCFMISPDLPKPRSLDWQKLKNLSSWTMMAMPSEWNANNMLSDRGSHCSLFAAPSFFTWCKLCLSFCHSSITMSHFNCVCVGWSAACCQHIVSSKTNDKLGSCSEHCPLTQLKNHLQS